MKKLVTKVLTLIIGLALAALVYFSLWGVFKYFEIIAQIMITFLILISLTITIYSLYFLSKWYKKNNKYGMNIIDRGRSSFLFVICFVFIFTNPLLFLPSFSPDIQFGFFLFSGLIFFVYFFHSIFYREKGMRKFFLELFFGPIAFIGLFLLADTPKGIKPPKNK